MKISQLTSQDLKRSLFQQRFFLKGTKGYCLDGE